ncbi:SusC/RagA family TonB-linked outer membrane protein [Mucilaginibacter rigui]|uniref:SusC/RagA family TonB-linked outer membrane protein n=1 Tax=Mucilaginibacter rigui TaxID=534635 RepID=A0ABR7X5N5_9SPHI|nr:SusC/RagA family TonB-linked outer membrane protein [Mucilaginibacter rigui]MBD1385887.1 SusC/RagA family TonB-linked outer membrane protein [Mucilaginibacter rigui]
MKTIIIAFLLAFVISESHAQSLIVGKVIDSETQRPLSGATLRINQFNLTLTSDIAGNFKFRPGSGDFKIAVSYIGYLPLTLGVNPASRDSIIILLERKNNELKEVVVSTGYQNIPKERATGSFEKVNNELLNRRVSTDIISRLEDVVPGLVFNRGTSNASYQTQISIRGQSTIFGKADPLIVIDNFPYDGNINNINPNDVESITVLKDAAAASIWGAKAGNGVIVITTKKGRYSQPSKVSFNSSVTIGDKPDLFYLSKISTPAFIEQEKYLFNKGLYNRDENSANKNPLTPVVELLIAQRDGKISAAEANAQIESFNSQDVRNDYNKYLYQQNVQQQYNVNLSGGTTNQSYYVSAGYDKNIANLVNNQYNRVSFNANHTYNFFNNHLDVGTGISYIQSDNIVNNQGTTGIYFSSNNGSALYPYAKLADGNGNLLPVNHDYRSSFLTAARQAGLLDWTYNPVQEVRLANNHAKITDYRFNFDLVYKIIPGLNASALYYYGRTTGLNSTVNTQDSYYARDLINKFSSVPADGSIVYPVPLGGIADFGNSLAIAQNFRGQINYAKNWNSKNDLTAIAGYEIRNTHTTNNQYREYGYDPEHATVTKVDYINYFPLYYNTASTLQIPNADNLSDLTDRYRSYYANIAYNYDSRYTISASGRIDQSNLFGVRTNQKGVPLWSTGIAWNVSNEPFYKVAWLPVLKIRATYGFNGNVNKSVTAYTTARYNSGIDNLSGLPYATITNPPNPDLFWERVKVVNLGVDFQAFNRRISGTLEYYHKNGIDLIGNAPYAPSSGIVEFRGNLSNNSGYGYDFSVQTRNLAGSFKWTTNFLFSKAVDKVTDYKIKGSGLSYLQLVYPLEGRPLYGVYSFKSAGLDPATGDPQGYLDGKISKDYTGIINAATPDSLQYNGPARPTMFGSFRNTFSFKGFSISANISYRLGYYFRRSSVNYATILTGQGGHGDFEKRWMKPGDEAFTQIPSMPAANNGNRNNFYMYSSALIEKGDHIRLQDINLSYTIGKDKFKWLPITNIQVYAYANNLGILWKATKTPLDPDYPIAQFPPVRTYAFGIRADL